MTGKLCGDLPLTAGAMYVLDRAYNNAGFWRQIDEAGALFVMRPKSNFPYDVDANLRHPDSSGRWYYSANAIAMIEEIPAEGME